MKISGGGNYPISGRRTQKFLEMWEIEITYFPSGVAEYSYNSTDGTTSAPGTFSQTYDANAGKILLTYTENGHSIQFYV